MPFADRGVVAAVDRASRPARPDRTVSVNAGDHVGLGAVYGRDLVRARRRQVSSPRRRPARTGIDALSRGKVAPRASF